MYERIQVAVSLLAREECDALSIRDVIDVLEVALTHEAAGKTDVSQKYITDFAGGAMRMLVAADHAAGSLASKAYHSIDAAGSATP